MQIRKMRIYLLSYFLLLAAFPAYADFCPCPSSFNIIQIGDSLDHISQICCKPTSQKKYPKQPNAPQTWSYYITPPVNTALPNGITQGSVKMDVVFDSNQKVTNISVNAQSLTSTNCIPSSLPYGGVNTPGSIKIGDTQQTVKTTCGTASFIQKGETPDNSNTAAPAVEVVEWQFAGPPPVTLLFEGGQLTEIKK